MRLDLGSVVRWDEKTRQDYEPDDEALIFLNDDNDQTIHVQCPNAKVVAKAIIAALSRS